MYSVHCHNCARMHSFLRIGIVGVVTRKKICPRVTSIIASTNVLSRSRMTMWSRNLTYSLILAIQLLWLKLSFIHASNPPRRNILVRKPLKQDNQQEALFSSKRKACGFYVWHVVSAGLHGLCQHLCKNCKYEGRGGREVSCHQFHDDLFRPPRTRYNSQMSSM